jgi:hypothetical protein
MRKHRDISPQAALGSWIAKLLDAPGTTGIRTSFGNFYTAIDAPYISVLAAIAPCGTTFTSPAPPLFASPIVSEASGFALAPTDRAGGVRVRQSLLTQPLHQVSRLRVPEQSALSSSSAPTQESSSDDAACYRRRPCLRFGLLQRRARSHMATFLVNWVCISVPFCALCAHLPWKAR